MSEVPSKWVPVAEALARGVRPKEAGALIGKKQGDVYAYRRNHPEFRELVSQLRDDAVQAAVGALDFAAIDAVKTLQRVTREGSSDAVQVRAAMGLLGALVSVSESAALRQLMADANARLDKLEGVAGDSQN
jgi:hypothetical protein